MASSPLPPVEFLRRFLQHVLPDRFWAEVLLCHAFDLATASDILRLHPKGVRRQVGNSNWYIRTHGIGVDIDGGLNRGGLDFDFDKPDPDPDRLLIFAERQVNAGNISVVHYLPLVDDEGRFRAAAGRVLEGLPTTIAVAEYGCHPRGVPSEPRQALGDGDASVPKAAQQAVEAADGRASS